MGLDLRGTVSLDGSGFETGLRGIEHGAARAGETLKSLAIQAFGIYGVEQAIHKTVETAAELVNESKRLGVGVEELQTLKQAAKDGGTELETMAKAFEKIDIAREKVLSGSKDAGKLMRRFTELGISTSDLRNMTSAQMFMGPMHKAANNMNPADLGPMLRDLMGRGFGDLIPVLKTDFDELRDKLQRFGLLMDTKTAVSLKTLGDEFDLISKIIVVSLGPALVAFANWLLDAIANSKVVEGLDFLSRKKAGLSALPDFTSSTGFNFSAKDRAVGASGAQETLTKAMSSGMPFADFLKGMSNNPMYEDFKGKNYHDLNKYFAGLVNPVSDVENDAASGAGKDMANMKAGLAELRKKIADAANALLHPVPPRFEPDPAEAGAGHIPGIRGMRSMAYTDSLARVGNFMGSGSNPMLQVAREQTALLKQIARNTGKISYRSAAINWPNK